MKATRFLLIVIVLLLCICCGRALGGWLCEPPARVMVYTYTVRPMDTLWNIAEAYAPAGCDLRNVVQDIRDLNGLETALIYPGQVLMVPVEEE